MFGLQSKLDEIINDHPRLLKLIIVSYIEKELRKERIVLSKNQIKKIEDQLNFNSDSITINLDFPDSQLVDSVYKSENELIPRLEEIMSMIGEHIENVTNDLKGLMEEVISGMRDELSERITDNMDTTFNDMIEDQQILAKNFSTVILNTWKKPLSILQGLIVISEEFIDAYHLDKTSKNDANIQKNVLIHLHAKAIKVAKEILTLLQKGFADGAEARWRTLHEVTVTSLFISDNGIEAAKRYYDHNYIESYKASIQYNNYYTKLGATKIPNADINRMKEIRDRLLKKYGKDFKYSYGWASSFLNIQNPKFSDIEKVVNLDHLRPYYKSASANVHSKPNGTFSSLGLLPEENLILGGPSNIGLSQPMQSTAISLLQISSAIMTLTPSLDTIVSCKIISNYVDKLYKEVETSESKLKRKLKENIHTYKRTRRKNFRKN